MINLPIQFPKDCTKEAAEIIRIINDAYRKEQFLIRVLRLHTLGYGRRYISIALNVGEKSVTNLLNKAKKLDCAERIVLETLEYATSKR